MSRRKDPASVVIDFFETAAPDAAQVMLRVVTNIVKRRAKTPSSPSPNQNENSDNRGER